MKQTLKAIIRNVKSIKGNSLAEFATTTALMATLAATAAPKLSEMSEGTKAEKSRNEIDKIIKQAGQFYQDTADSEGRGRFPGQTKFNAAVGNSGYQNIDASQKGTEDAYLITSKGHHDAVLDDLGLRNGDGWQKYNLTPTNAWISVFGIVTQAEADASDGELEAYAGAGVSECEECTDEWLTLFGGEVLESKFQDGHYAYTVVGGGGSGNEVFPPVMYVVDVENAVDFNSVLEP